MHTSACLVLDASCLLNLYGTNRLREIALAVEGRLEVAEYVMENEVIYTWQTDSTGTRETAVPVDLTPLVSEGLIRILKLERTDDQETFLALAAVVDDGEAATAALAARRGCSIATDDRKARRVFGELIPEVPIVSTLELLKLWADESQVPEETLREVMVAMRRSTSYVPSSRDPLFGWWASIMSSSD